jgi:hypothetical protein
MATSGTTAYSVTERDIIEEAASHLGVLQIGQTMEADEYIVFRRKLNLLMKQWTAQIDFAPGLKMWTRRRAWLFPQSGQVVYSLGPSGDECAAESYVMTTLSANATGSTATLTSTTGFASGYRIGIRLDTGAMHWTTVDGALSGSVATLTTAVPSIATAGATVFCYATKMQRPFSLVSASLRQTNGDDWPVDTDLSVEEYELISRKSNTGVISGLYFEAQRTNAKVYTDVAPADTRMVLRMVYLAYVEDLTASTQDVDFPAEWFRPLAAQLAVDSAPAFAKPVTVELKMLRDESLRIAQNAYPAKSEAFYLSDPDVY